MNSITIDCPHCHTPFELTQALGAPLIDEARAAATAEAERRFQLERQAAELAAREEAARQLAAEREAHRRALEAQAEQVEAARAAELAAMNAKAAAEQAAREVELTVRRQVESQRQQIEAGATARAEELAASRIAALEAANLKKDERLREAEAAELTARQTKAEADEALRQVELTVARRMDDERQAVRAAVIKERDDEARLRLAEKDKQLEDLRTALKDAESKAARGSQQLVGEVLELDIADTLANAFPDDVIERVKKGQPGGDVIHIVRNSRHQVCGRIVWEAKHTKSWLPGWVKKLREDQREAKADIAALASSVLPPEVDHFDLHDGIWVTGLPTVVPMAQVLRHGLIETARARVAATSAVSKKDQVYAYLTSQEFRARIRGALEPVIEMRTDLDREKRLLTKQWAGREKQIDRLANSISGVYGDLHGIVGASLPAVEGLTLVDTDEGTEAPRLGLVPELSAAGTED